MSPLGVIVAGALLLVGGCWIVAAAWRPRPSVDAAMRRLRAPNSSRTSTEKWFRVPQPLTPRLADWELPLRLVGRSVERHVGLLALAALIGFTLPTLLLAVLRTSGAISIGLVIPIAISIAAGVGAAALVHSDTMARAALVATDLRYQLGAYIDMVTMLLAGNSGYEGALERAASTGDGRLFEELRRRMRETSTTGRSLVDALFATADELGLSELQDVAATTSLSAAEGAPVARTLAAKCSTMRSTLAATQEAEARIRTDKVTPPLVAMALLFMALIIYPALDLA